MAENKQQVLGGIAPYLMVSDAAGAADFYKKAFNAEEVHRMAADDGKRHMHIHLHIHGNSVMLSDFFPEYGHAYEKPAAFNLHLQVTDIDSWWDRALAAGAEIAMPKEKQFWGDIYGQVKDPYGVTWAFGQSV